MLLLTRDLASIQYNLLEDCSEKILIQLWIQVINYLLPRLTRHIRFKISIFRLSIPGIVVHVRCYISHWFYFSALFCLLVGWFLFFVSLKKFWVIKNPFVAFILSSLLMLLDFIIIITALINYIKLDHYIITQNYINILHYVILFCWYVTIVCLYCDYIISDPLFHISDCRWSCVTFAVLSIILCSLR